MLWRTEGAYREGDQETMCAKRGPEPNVHSAPKLGSRQAWRHGPETPAPEGGQRQDQLQSDLKVSLVYETDRPTDRPRKQNLFVETDGVP